MIEFLYVYVISYFALGVAFFAPGLEAQRLAFLMEGFFLKKDDWRAH